MTGINLFALFGEEAAKLFGDPITLVNVLYVLCRHQCMARQMSDEDFGPALIGDTLEQAANALLEEVRDFFPASRRRILQATIDKSRELQQEAETTLLNQINRLTPASLQKTSSKRSTKSPG